MEPFVATLGAYTPRLPPLGDLKRMTAAGITTALATLASTSPVKFVHEALNRKGVNVPAAGIEKTAQSHALYWQFLQAMGIPSLADNPPRVPVSAHLHYGVGGILRPDLSPAQMEEWIARENVKRTAQKLPLYALVPEGTAGFDPEKAREAMDRLVHVGSFHINQTFGGEFDHQQVGDVRFMQFKDRLENPKGGLEVIFAGTGEDIHKYIMRMQAARNMGREPLVVELPLNGGSSPGDPVNPHSISVANSDAVVKPIAQILQYIGNNKDRFANVGADAEIIAAGHSAGGTALALTLASNPDLYQGLGIHKVVLFNPMTDVASVTGITKMATQMIGQFVPTWNMPNADTNVLPSTQLLSNDPITIALNMRIPMLDPKAYQDAIRFQTVNTWNAMAQRMSDDPVVAEQLKKFQIQVVTGTADRVTTTEAHVRFAHRAGAGIISVDDGHQGLHASLGSEAQVKIDKGLAAFVAGVKLPEPQPQPAKRPDDPALTS